MEHVLPVRKFSNELIGFFCNGKQYFPFGIFQPNWPEFKHLLGLSPSSFPTTSSENLSPGNMTRPALAASAVSVPEGNDLMPAYIEVDFRLEV